MKILNMVSKSFTCPLITLKLFWSEISKVVEISTDFDVLSIIEFQIYSFISPILQANLGKILAKMLSNCYILKSNTIYLFLKSFQMKIFSLHSQSDSFSESVSCSSSATQYQSRMDFGTKLSSIPPFVFRRSACMKYC